MKKNQHSFMAALALGGLVAFGPGTQAQEKKVEVKPAAPATPPTTPPARPAPPRDRTAQVAEFLKLDDAQKAKAKPILDEENTKMLALRQDKAVTREDRMVKYKEIREATNEKMKPLLTPEQVEKWARMRGLGPKPAPPSPPAPPTPPTPAPAK